MALAQTLGYVGAFLTTFATVPQIVKAWRTKHTKDISVWYFSMLTLGIIFWLVYGIMIREGPLIFANTISLTLNASVLYLKLKYG